jgi:hypothetical protein
MMSSGMLRRVAFVRTDISEERSACIFRVTRIGELGKLAATSNRRTLRRNIKCKCIVFLRSVRLLLVTANVPSSPILFALKMEALCSSETSVLTRATGRNNPEELILHIQELVREY